MGLLDEVLGGVLGSPSRGNNNTNPPIMDALTELLAPRRGGGSGGGLGDLLGGLAGQSGSGQMSGGGMGGLGGLIESFTRSGHGDIADSWVSSGQNRPVAPHQLEQALGGNTIDNLVRRTGLPRDQLLEQLSMHLPNAVDRLTPQGRMPAPETMNHW